MDDGTHEDLPKPAAKAKSTMTDTHKAALAQGRLEGRAVRDYLDALRATKPKRGASGRPIRSATGWPPSTGSCRMRHRSTSCD